MFLERIFKQSQNINLLEGSIYKSLFSLASPITITSLASMAYSFIDMLWIGRLGAGAVAAVGTANFFLWFCEGIMRLSSMGGQVFTAQYLGAKKMEEARLNVRSSLQLALLTGILTALTLILVSPYLIAFFPFEEQSTINAAIQYLRVMASLIFLSFLTRVYTGIATAMGNSRICLRFSICGLILNTLLDPLFIFTFKLGVVGAALASIFSIFIVFLLFTLYLRKTELFLGQNFLVPAFKPWFKLIRLGFPAAIQTMFLSFIAMYIGRMVGRFGENSIAIQRVGAQIESISWMTTDGFSMAINAFIAQNFGANQWDRAKKGYFTALKIVIALGLFSTLLLYFAGEDIFSLFIQDPILRLGGGNYLRILAYSQIFMCIEIMTGSAFNGFAKSVVPSTIITLFTLARIPTAYALAFIYGWGLNGIWWAITFSSIIKGILLLLSFLYFLYSSEKIHRQEDLYK